MKGKSSENYIKTSQQPDSLFSPAIFTTRFKNKTETFFQLVENTKHPHSFLTHTIQTVTVSQHLLPCLSKALTS